MESEQNKNFFEKSYDRIADYVRRNPRRSAIYTAAIVLFLLGFFVPVEAPHVSLSGEPIFSDGPAWLTNSLITTVLVDLILIVMALAATVRMKEIPGRWQNLIEAMLEYLYGLSESVAGRGAPLFSLGCDHFPVGDHQQLVRADPRRGQRRLLS